MTSDLFSRLSSAYAEIDYTIIQLKHQKESISNINGEERKEIVEMLGALLMDIEIIAQNLNELFTQLSLE
jgi:hypothetical protein